MAKDLISRASRRVRFDDRLMTVLNQPAGNRHDQAVRWRQLVDLVARSGSAGESAAVTRALADVADKAPSIDQAVRAAAARAIAALPLPLGLLEVFARDTLAVSAPVLAAASLTSSDWQQLVAIADEETRRFIITLHPEADAGPMEDNVDEPAFTDTLVLSEPVPVPEPVQSPAAPASRSLADVVARIERRQRRHGAISRLAFAPGGDAPLSLFRWECSPSGEIQWVDGVPRGAFIGRSIAQGKSTAGEGPADEVVRAFAHRAPFRDAAFAIAGDGIVAGEWKMSGVPAFEPSDGRFAGYRGIAMRDRPESADAVSAAAPPIADPDSLRELVHEIKTPLNAIIGFAEIIDGQFLGPADRRYRRRAAHIVSQARLLLGGIDDLDFAAKVQAAAAGSEPRTALGGLVEELLPDLRLAAQQAGAEIDTSRSIKQIDAAISEQLAERVVRRTLTAVIEQAARGEKLLISVDRVGTRCRVAIARPAALKGISDENLFGQAPAEDDEPSARFSLRLARGLARIAGVALTASDRDIALSFERA